MNPRNLMILSDVQTVYLCVHLSTCLVFLAVHPSIHPSIQHPSIYACPCKNLQQDPHDENCQCPVVLLDPLGAVPMQKPQLVNGTIRPLLRRPLGFPAILFADSRQKLMSKGMPGLSSTWVCPQTSTVLP